MKRATYLTPLNEEGGDIHPLTSIWTGSSRPSFWLGRPYRSPNYCICNNELIFIFPCIDVND